LERGGNPDLSEDTALDSLEANQFVSEPKRRRRCALPAHSKSASSLIPPNLLNNLTKLAKAKFFSRTQD